MVRVLYTVLRPLASPAMPFNMWHFESSKRNLVGVIARLGQHLRPVPILVSARVFFIRWCGVGFPVRAVPSRDGDRPPPPPSPGIRSQQAVAHISISDRLCTNALFYSVYFLRIEYAGWELGSEPRGITAAVLDLSESESSAESDIRDSGDAGSADTAIELLDMAFYNDVSSVLLARAHGEFIRLYVFFARFVGTRARGFDIPR